MKSRQTLLLAAAGVAAWPAAAAEVSIKVTIPEIAATGPRPPTRPYVAIWLRKDDNSFVSNLAVWYQIENKQRERRPPGQEGAGNGAGAGGQPGAQRADGPPGDGAPRGDGPPKERKPDNPRTPGGARWLNEVRQWWADSGNELQFPVDGLTSASRAAGTHELTFSSADPKFARLPPGKYKLMVEASREHGGEETIAIPFTWPAKSAQSGQASGKTELGAVELTFKP
ncbi:MAG: DUF2271 domain-containing protein [Pseudomonadota bacterium]